MTEKIKISAIDDSGGLRPVDPDHVALLAQSIEQGRLEQPISVRPLGDGYKLIVGGNRLAALKMLGWEELTVGEHVIIRDSDDDEARQAEVDENLVRSELTQLERLSFLAERKETWLRSTRPSGRGGDRKSQKYKEEIKPYSIGFDFDGRFSKHAAKRFGMSEKSVEQALTLAKKLQDDTIAAIRGTMVANNLQELLALGDIKGDEQIAAARLIQSGQAKTVLQARIVLDPKLKPSDDPQAALFPAFIAIWKKADKFTRAAIKKHIEADRK